MIAHSIANYLKSGIEITLIKKDQEIPTVIIKQVRLINGYLLNQKQLIERAKAVFNPQKIHVIPSVHSLDVEHINSKWIIEKQKEFGIHNKDFIKQLALKKSDLKPILKGDVELSYTTKAAFFYYFLVYELNKKMRKKI